MTSSNQLKVKTIKVLIKVEEDTDGSFVVTCPQIGCIFVQEHTEEDAIKYGIEAIDTYIQMSVENQQPMPKSIMVFENDSDIPIPRRIQPMNDFELT